MFFLSYYDSQARLSSDEEFYSEKAIAIESKYHYIRYFFNFCFPRTVNDNEFLMFSVVCFAL